mgnify:CR=1 FL=1|tara:strand:- start:908 stop:1465 length:558 start_codon:yes stop_codon:yes gene_type:complete
MKKTVVRLLLGLSFIVFVFLSLKYDSKRYDYGWDCVFCSNTLPYNIEPKFNFEYPQSFVLMDDDDFELMGIGFRYRNSDFKIKNFLGYGYNDTSIVAKVTDSLNNIKYLSSYETGNKSDNGSPEISFEDMSETKFEQVKDKYRWTDLVEGSATEITMKRLLFFTGAIISLLLLLWQLISKRKVTQ